MVKKFKSLHGVPISLSSKSGHWSSSSQYPSPSESMPSPIQIGIPEQLQFMSYYDEPYISLDLRSFFNFRYNKNSLVTIYEKWI